MERKLEGKIAVVTGGTTGIGLATARRFAAEGARAPPCSSPPPMRASSPMAGGLLHVAAFGGGRISLDGRRA